MQEIKKATKKPHGCTIHAVFIVSLSAKNAREATGMALRALFLRIHAVGRHKIIDLFTVLLLFLLNVIECISDLLVLKLKNAGVIYR